jgi:hypothetical protein
MKRWIADLTREEQNAIQRDLKAALWAYEISIGKRSLREVRAVIQRLGDLEKQIDMNDRLDKYMAMRAAKTVNANNVNNHRSNAKQRGRLTVGGCRPEIAGSRAGEARSSDGLWNTPIN